MTDHYVDSTGKYIGGFGDGAKPDDSDLINLLDNPPEYADQVWGFPGWSESPSAARARETAWRDEQMPAAQQNVTAIEYGAKDIPGSAQQWRAYWLDLRKWTETNPDFPYSSERPVAPS